MGNCLTFLRVIFIWAVVRVFIKKVQVLEFRGTGKQETVSRPGFRESGIRAFKPRGARFRGLDFVVDDKGSRRADRLTCLFQDYR